MAWRYRNPSGQFVSERAWKASKARGGDYRRESDRSYSKPEPAAKTPRTADSYDDIYSGYDDFDEFFEIDTGVDY